MKSLKLQHAGKLWILDNETATELKFKVAPMGGGVIEKYMQQWRKRNKMSQAEAGKFFNLSQSTIGKIENGTRRMPRVVFEQIHADNLRNYGRK